MWTNSSKLEKIIKSGFYRKPRRPRGLIHIPTTEKDVLIQNKTMNPVNVKN